MLAQQPVRGYLSWGEWQVWEVLTHPFTEGFVFTDVQHQVW